MALPDKFSHSKHLINTVIEVHNKNVKEEFRDVGDDDWSPNTNTSRGSLRVAATIRPNDSMIMVAVRLFFYYFVLRKTRDLFEPVYGMPINDYPVKRNGRPMITLYFAEDSNDIPKGKSQLRSELSFRLMDETNKSLTDAKLRTLALEIKNIFGKNDGYRYKKGKDMATYNDWDSGYAFKLLITNRTDAKELVQKILAIQDHTPNWTNFNYKENESPTETYPNNPGTITILGERYTQRQLRRVAYVRFKYALIDIAEIPKPMCLFDRTLTFWNPVVA